MCIVVTSTVIVLNVSCYGCSETDGAVPLAAEQGSYSESQSPQSVGSGAMDSGTEYLSDSTSYNMDVSMSLCGQEGDTSQITKGTCEWIYACLSSFCPVTSVVMLLLVLSPEKFMKHLLTYQDFAKNPGIIEDPNLVICINSK